MDTALSRTFHDRRHTFRYRAVFPALISRDHLAVSSATSRASACGDLASRSGIASQRHQLFAHARIVERLDERHIQPRDDSLRRRLGREQRIPRRHLKLRESASAEVGTLGSAGLRAGVPTAKAFTAPL